MAVDLARTFLAIVRCGSFVGAAEHLHLTQAAITARVQSLESQLNCSLFVRNRSGATLTPNGENGKFKFDGQLTCYPTGGGVNEVVDLNISIAPSTPITLDATE